MINIYSINSSGRNAFVGSQDNSFLFLGILIQYWTKQITPEDEFYDDEDDEWVLLIQGKARFLFLNIENNEEYELNNVDTILIKAHQKPRVTYTSVDPPCIWLAVYGKMA